MLSDRIAVLPDGRMVAEGTTQGLRASVAKGRSLEEFDVEAVYMELTR